MSKLRLLWQVGGAFGLRDGLLRLDYEARRSTGILARRMQSAEGWASWTLEKIAPRSSAEELLRTRRAGASRFFFSDARSLAPRLSELLGAEAEKEVVMQAERILAGELPFFGRLFLRCGFPSNWFRNPVTGQSVSPQRPWTTMRFASPDYGDLKFILESSRFLFVYTLARAYALSGDDRYAEAFWSVVEDWARQSPPMSGPLWICGQESALRILAWCFGLYAFLHSPATTAERVGRLTSMIAAHAWRTQQTIGYARSQRSNHLISEAVGLWTAGTLFPELKDAAVWQRQGVELLEEAVLDQITPEGVHLQYSFNYQRMVLQLLLWALRLAPLHGARLPNCVAERARAGLDFVRNFSDTISGRVPNYGANDGTMILPLTSCDYSDFRPLLRLGDAVLGGGSRSGVGPWDEASLWLCGGLRVTSTATPPAVPSLPASSGYYRLGSGDSWAMVRAGHYSRRPFQADQLHVDLWHGGVNLAGDPGTYLYNGDPPWDNGLARTAVHNTVTLDGQDQMLRAGRFLWVDWAQASVRSFSRDKSGGIDSFEGEHDGYGRFGVQHCRAVRWTAEAGWIIVDDVLGTGQHQVQLHWLVPELALEEISDSPAQIMFGAAFGRVQWHFESSVSGRLFVVCAGKGVRPGAGLGGVESLGWNSPTYGELRPAISLVYETNAPLPVRMVTVVGVSEALRIVSTADAVVLYRADAEIARASLTPGASPFPEEQR